ncbi:MAG: hypothetical protein AB7T06_33460 [Kofleriaceae bacterium]
MALATFLASSAPTRECREVRDRAGSTLSIVLAASIVPLLVIATLAVVTLLA